MLAYSRARNSWPILLLERSISVISPSHLVPIKLMNRTSGVISIGKNMVLATFTVLDAGWRISQCNETVAAKCFNGIVSESVDLQHKNGDI